MARVVATFRRRLRHAFALWLALFLVASPLAASVALAQGTAAAPARVEAPAADPGTKDGAQATFPAAAPKGKGAPAEAGASEATAEDSGEKGFLEKLAPILILLAVIAFVIARLPRVDLGHSAKYRARRVQNWLPLGLTYMSLYMGRYNLTVAKDQFGDLMDNQDFSTIFGIGTVVYGVSFLINGPMTDRIGGKKAILIGAFGALIANLAMGFVTVFVGEGDAAVAANLTTILSVLYAANMYAQSFGAVAIVKSNAPWFHVRERGVFGAIFGVLISLGIYLAFDVGFMIVSAFETQWVFFIPAILLTIFWVVVFARVENTPGEAGYEDFDTGDASSGDDGPRLPAMAVFKMMMSNPIIVTIACIEFCSGFLRQAIMQWYRTFAKQTDGMLGEKGSFVYENWGMLLCAAGILGGVFAGVISDRIFASRRGPVAAILYAGMLLGALVMVFVYTTPMVGWLIVAMSLCVIGVHGMLSGTASMDFGGKKNVGVAVGIIDGFVYLGTGTMAATYGILLPQTGPEAADPANWIAWPIAMVPVALIGLLLATRIWNAKPQPKGGANVATK